MPPPPRDTDPVVHVLYRYTASVGSKPRPPYFSKKLALQSFGHALNAAAGRVTVTFLVDGELPEDLAVLMGSLGMIRRGRWGSNRASYAEQLRLATRSSAQLVWFAEDDYLYTPDALTSLVSAVTTLPAVNWFALSGPTPLAGLEMTRAQSSVPLPLSQRWTHNPSSRAGSGHAWRRIDSTTSTFGGRPDAIRRAHWLLRLCPWSGAAWDRTTCLALQGATPYPWRYVLTDLLPPSTPSEKRAPRVAWRIASRLAVNVAARTQRSRQEVLVAPTVPLIGHMDLPYESHPETWNSLADEMARE